MPHVQADRETCEGYGNCVVTAPAHFDLDDDGKVVVVQAEVAEADRGVVDAAVKGCPVAALSWADE